MAVLRQSINSRSDAVSNGVVPAADIIRPIPDFIKKINMSIMAIPLARLVGKGESYDQLKLEFGTSDYAPVMDSLGAAVTDTSGTSWTVTTGNAFQVWDEIVVAATTGVDPAEAAEHTLITAT